MFDISISEMFDMSLESFGVGYLEGLEGLPCGRHKSTIGAMNFCSTAGALGRKAADIKVPPLGQRWRFHAGEQLIHMG